MPPDPGPFPRDPRAGQFEWAVILPGLGGQVALASGADGSIFVAGGHHAAIDVGGNDAHWLKMRRARVAALRIWSRVGSVDLGTAAEPGDNALSSSPSGHAIVDEREDIGAPLDAAGTTLNGRTYSGELHGPRDTSDLKQRAANIVRF